MRLSQNCVYSQEYYAILWPQYVALENLFTFKNNFKLYISCNFSSHSCLATTDTPESSDSGLAVPQESSRQEPPPPPTEEPQSQILSSLRLENQLLRSEVASLNQEMASVIQRAKDLQDG